MRRILVLIPMAIIGIIALLAPSASAVSPHFVKGPTATRSGDSLTVSGKEAGLGNSLTVTIEVSATAACINPGGKDPKAANKQNLAEDGQFQVRNGSANFSVTLTASFQPSCSPPMTVQFSNVVVTDVDNGLSVKLPGTF
ncbi:MULTISPECIES: hypothetical protein [unclassified Streptomyces]|uniref:hypothetical protein n=1 Tax=unclassified Streptomyces TaxID=2593676 RepID=UPI002365BF63|nr:MULTISPECIES: hypothetical protein [unclassified Streptomyces]MDF3144263.1 hypothetical protein [Streptomyces sp. T21Q-yed]WDF37812.1 hypothetical protein PBV52_13850 [Streptomyces sp. T12]